MHRMIWSIPVLLGAAFVLSARPLQAQAACYHCSNSSTDETWFCHPISPEGGRTSCSRTGVESESSCSTSGSSCSSYAIRDIAPDGGITARFAGSIRKPQEPGSPLQTGTDSGREYVRRPCDGVVVDRRYTPEVAARMHVAARELTI